MDSRDYHWLAVVARMRPEATRTQVAAELGTLATRLALSYPDTDKGNNFTFEQAGSLPSRQRTTVLLFLAALSVVVLLVLVIAGANVANLLFAQAAARQREMAVRLALGATRSGLRRQMLFESIWLGLGGGVVGVMLSLWATQALSAFHLPAPIPLDIKAWRSTGECCSTPLPLVSSADSSLGLAPAWAASHPKLAKALKGEDALARPGRRLSLRSLLVVGQIAMSVVLLCVTGSSLCAASSKAPPRIDIGFHTENLLADVRRSSSAGWLHTRKNSLISQPGATARLCSAGR